MRRWAASGKNEEQDTATPGDKGDDKTAAASAAATTQEEETETEEKKGPAQTRSAKTSESRWAKITRENREMRERLQRLETSQTKETPRETQQPSQAATDAKTANPKPKIDDVDPKTGKAKYSTYQEFEDAKDEWLRKDTLREFSETSAKTAKERELQQAKETIVKEWGKRVEKAETKYSDYRDVALNPDLPIKEGSVVDGFILTRPKGAEVLYYLGQNPEVLDSINAMTPFDAAYALSEIELSLPAISGKSSSARPVTQAPRPPHQVSGKGAVTKDAVEQAVDDQDFETYAAAQNARDLVRLKRK